MVGLGTFSAKIISRTCASLKGANSDFSCALLKGVDWSSPEGEVLGKLEWLSPEDKMLAWRSAEEGRDDCWNDGRVCCDGFEALSFTSLELELKRPQNSRSLPRFLMRTVLLALSLGVVWGSNWSRGWSDMVSTSSDYMSNI